jgi:hypothetical protein
MSENPDGLEPPVLPRWCLPTDATRPNAIVTRISTRHTGDDQARSESTADQETT